MKQQRIIFWIFLLIFSFQISTFSNSLTKLEVFKGDLSTEFMLVFTQPCDYSIQQNPKDISFTILFKDAKDHAENQDEVRKKLNALAAQVKNFQIKNSLAGVEVTFYCSNDHSYIQCHALENKSRYMVKVFSLKALEELQNRPDSQLVYAFSSSTQTPDKKKTFATAKHPCIVLDSGHGGEAYGAQGFFGLIEKNLALDITKKVKNLLEKNGHLVILTRDRDCDKSLLERSEIASAANADLFISIHANSSGGPKEPQGIETFHVNADNLCVTEHRGADYLFNNPHSLISCRNLINSVTKKREHQSELLASSIQSHLLSTLQSHNLKPINRGVKKALFNVLLRGKIPAALVEVGFLTNEHEARLLAQEAYQNLIAQGISNGIENFLKN